MALTVPNFDDRTFEQLVVEGRSLIPRYSSEWTNHNLSDPGITLLELFAYLTEAAIYQLNQVPPASIEQFLRLIDVCRQDENGEPETIPHALQRALATLGRQERAITGADFKELAITTAARIADQQTTAVISEDRPARTQLREPLHQGQTITQLVVRDAIFKAGEHLVIGDETPPLKVVVNPVVDRTLTLDASFVAPVTFPGVPRVGRVLFTTVQDPTCTPDGSPGDAPLAAVIVLVPEDLESADTPGLRLLLKTTQAELRLQRLLTTRLRVLPPTFLAVEVTGRVTRRPGSTLTGADVARLIESFLHPIRGGPDGAGWPFGRDVYRSELFQRLEREPGIDHVDDLRLSTDDAARIRPEGIEVAPDELVTVRRVDVIVTDLTTI